MKTSSKNVALLRTIFCVFLLLFAIPMIPATSTRRHLIAIIIAMTAMIAIITITFRDAARNAVEDMKTSSVKNVQKDALKMPITIPCLLFLIVKNVLKDVLKMLITILCLFFLIVAISHSNIFAIIIAAIILACCSTEGSK
jgi:Na+/melibiose symporter-like transporter